MLQGFDLTAAEEAAVRKFLKQLLEKTALWVLFTLFLLFMYWPF